MKTPYDFMVNSNKTALTGSLACLFVTAVLGCISPVAQAQLNWHSCGNSSDGSSREHFSGGYLDSSGKVVVPAIFSQVEKFYDGVAVVKQVRDEHVRPQAHVLIDRTGKVLSERFVGYRIHDRSPDIALEFENGWYICSRTGSPKYGPYKRCDALIGNKAFVFQSGCLSIFENGQVLKRLKGIRYVIPCRYSDLLLARARSCTGVINAKGDWVVPPIFDEIGDFSGGLAVAKFPPSRAAGKNACNSRACYIAQDGRIVFPKRFSNAYAFVEGFAAIAVVTEKNEERWGIINKAGDVVLEPSYKYIAVWKNGIALLFLDDRTKQLYDCRTKSFGIKANHITALGNQMYAVQLKSNPGSFHLQRSWKELCTIQPEVVVNGFCGGFDENTVGPSLVPFFTEVGTVKRFGWLDRSGQVRIPPNFSYAREFSEGLAGFYIPDDK